MFKTRVSKICSINTLKKRLPILKWLPHYKTEYILQDIIAGITVGLTAIAQGIAIAVMTGLPPEYGLYASLTSGIVYVFFGSRHNLTVGPTTILSTVVVKYVSNYSADFAILTSFLSGVVMLIMGVFNLGFIVEFISMPVISGFTTAACLQGGALQLKPIFGLSGPSGLNFIQSMYYFFLNIKTMKPWELILASATILMLILLKRLGNDCKITDGLWKQIRLFISLSRNAIVVVVGMIIAYIVKLTLKDEPFSLLGDTGNGLPTFSWPPFSTVVENETFSFVDMIQILGPAIIVVPLISILEVVAVAKIFAEGVIVDATQEMIAVGLCNIVGSFGQSMPITGSFLRTALNQISGVKTPAGGITKVLLIVIALTLMTSTFYYIPKASLAALILVAAYSMMNFVILFKLWNNSKGEFIVVLSTIIVGLVSGLEYGILAGVVIEALMALFKLARPTVEVNIIKTNDTDVIVVTLSDNVLYCAAEHVRKVVLKASLNSDAIIIIDGTNLKHIDYTVASNLVLMVSDLENKSKDILFMNFNSKLKDLCCMITSELKSKFVYGFNVSDVMNITCKNVQMSN